MINIRMQHREVQKLTPKITVIGVGGAGGNAVNNMISAGLQGVEFVVCNTDAQALEGSLCENKVQLGMTVTGGLGAGARPEVGRSAAEETLDDVMSYLEGANMAFITAGMGGGTGTGAAPVVARACREKGILTVGVVTKPFHFEGTTRMRMAESGIEEMQQYVDTLIVIPNQNLFRIANEKTTFAEAFRLADSVLQSGVRGVTDLMIMPGLINLDFADIRSAMLEMGKAMMGTGEATGDKRAIEAAEKAINNPLLDDVSMKGARGVIINVTGGYDMTLFEVDEACNRIRDEVDPNANIIFGSTFDESLEGIMRVSVVATGIDVAEEQRPHHHQGRTGSNGGGGNNRVSLNAITAQQQERRLERARPNTEPVHAVVASAVVEPVRAQSYIPLPQHGYATMGAAAARAASVPPPVTAATAAQARVEEATHEMLEQRETNPAEHSMRGSVYNDSFIPPRPIEVEPQPNRDAFYGPNLGSLTARRQTVEAQQVQSNASLVLRPPVPGSATAQQAPRKSPPSLFERLTGPLRHHGTEPRETAAMQSQPADNAASVRTPQQQGSSFHARQTQPLQQGSLNIDAPVRDAADDELDIPAFLRRQAN